MKTHHCDECANARYAYDQNGYGGSLWCSKKHKPKFCKPKWNYMDSDWGYKRKCGDFKMSKRVIKIEVK